MPIPQAEKPHNDLIDLLTDACMTIQQVRLPNGGLERQLIQDPKKVWYKTQIINSPTFGRCVFELETLDSKRTQCYNHMSQPRALVMDGQLEGVIKAFQYSIDAKSSESLRDKNNTQSTLIDKINRNKIEKAYTVKGAGTKTFMDGLLGRDGDKESQEDN